MGENEYDKLCDRLRLIEHHRPSGDVPTTLYFSIMNANRQYLEEIAFRTRSKDEMFIKRHLAESLSAQNIVDCLDHTLKAYKKVIELIDDAYDDADVSFCDRSLARLKLR